MRLNFILSFLVIMLCIDSSMAILCGLWNWLFGGGYYGYGYYYDHYYGDEDDNSNDTSRNRRDGLRYRTYRRCFYDYDGNRICRRYRRRYPRFRYYRPYYRYYQNKEDTKDINVKDEEYKLRGTKMREKRKSG